MKDYVRHCHLRHTKTLNTCVLLDLVVIVRFCEKLLLVVQDIIYDPGVVLYYSFMEVSFTGWYTSYRFLIITSIIGKRSH